MDTTGTLRPILGGVGLRSDPYLTLRMELAMNKKKFEVRSVAATPALAVFSSLPALAGEGPAFSHRMMPGAR